MFGNGFPARVGPTFLAALRLGFQPYCMPSVPLFLHGCVPLDGADVTSHLELRGHTCEEIAGEMFSGVAVATSHLRRQESP